MDYKGRMDAYVINSFLNLPDEIISAIRQRVCRYYWYIVYYIYITLLYLFNY